MTLPTDKEFWMEKADLEEGYTVGAGVPEETEEGYTWEPCPFCGESRSVEDTPCISKAAARITELERAIKDSAEQLESCADFIYHLPKEMSGGYNTRTNASEQAEHNRMLLSLKGALLWGKGTG